MIRNPVMPLENYSTEETVVGTWINGKPIYRVVVQSSFNSSKTTLTLLSGTSSYVDEVVSLSGGILLSGAYCPLPWVSVNFNTKVALFLTAAGDICSEHNSTTSNMGGTPIFAIFEYTKQSDTATATTTSATALAASYDEGVNEA